MAFYVSERLTDRCLHCGFCERYILCQGEGECVGCGACVEACPNRAKAYQEVSEKRSPIRVFVDGEAYEVPERLTVLRALELLGYKFSRFPGLGDIYAPCRTGGCWACVVLVDGGLKPSCVTAVYEGMVIDVDRAHVARRMPLRLVSGFQGHAVGGVGTPYWLKPKGWSQSPIEAACFAHGCILRCPTCQNWETTYSSVSVPLTPSEAAEVMTALRRECRVDRMAISGGECTLNRRWLGDYLKALGRLNPDDGARFHVDTNAVVLTPDYIDELVQAGMTDIGPDVKGLELETFVRITGLKDMELARKLQETEWNAVKYLLDNYYSKVFIGVGIPYNQGLISIQEVYRIGERIAGWESNVQVCVLDYRPEFRRLDIKRPSYSEMVRVKRVLEETGLRCVVCQTERGHIGPEKV